MPGQLCKIVHTNFGAIICQERYRREIAISSSSLEKLNTLRADIQTAMDLKKKTEWTLEEMGTDVILKTTVEDFKGEYYVHVRKHFKGNPTRQGVALNMEEWTALMDLFKMDGEVLLAIEAAASLILEKKGTNCEGCDKAWPSQLDHACMSYGHAYAADPSLEEMIHTLGDVEIILRMAKLAAGMDRVLQQPGWAVSMMRTLHVKEVKEIVGQ